MDEKGWLGKEIKAAVEEVETWGPGMRRENENMTIEARLTALEQRVRELEGKNETWDGKGAAPNFRKGLR